MRDNYRRQLERHARRHGVKLVGVWNVRNRQDLWLAKQAIAEAALVLEVTGDFGALTKAMRSEVTIHVERLPAD
jgi:hypothetical protein